MGDPREATDPLIRQALVDGLRDRMGYPQAQGLPELRAAIADWAGRRFGVDARPGHAGDPDPRQQGGDLQLRAGRGGSRRPAGTRSPTPSPATPSTSAALSSPAPEPLALPLREQRRVPAGPRRDRRGDVAPAGRLLGQLPEQPDRRRRAARVLRAARGARAQSTASSSPRTRPTRSSGSTSRRPRRCRSPI